MCSLLSKKLLIYLAQPAFMDPSPTELELKVKHYLIFFSSLLSFLATLATIITYAVLTRLKTHGFRVIVGLSLSNLLLAFSHLLTGFYLWTSDTSSYKDLCYVQAVLSNFAQLASIFWIAALSWIMYSNIVIPLKFKARRARVYYFITYTLAASFTIG